jgi:hypothetical protein
MKAVIDRIEDDWIVFVDDKERLFEIPLEYYAEAEEGDHVEIMLTKEISSQEEAENRIDDLRSKLRRVSIGD